MLAARPARRRPLNAGGTPLGMVEWIPPNPQNQKARSAGEFSAGSAREGPCLPVRPRRCAHRHRERAYQGLEGHVRRLSIRSGQADGREVRPLRCGRGLPQIRGRQETRRRGPVVSEQPRNRSARRQPGRPRRRRDGVRPGQPQERHVPKGPGKGRRRGVRRVAALPGGGLERGSRHRRGVGQRQHPRGTQDHRSGPVHPAAGGRQHAARRAHPRQARPGLVLARRAVARRRSRRGGGHAR